MRSQTTDGRYRYALAIIESSTLDQKERSGKVTISTQSKRLWLYGTHGRMTVTAEYAIELGRQVDELEAENEQLRAALNEIILRHDLGGTADECVRAWERVRELATA